MSSKYKSPTFRLASGAYALVTATLLAHGQTASAAVLALYDFDGTTLLAPTSTHPGVSASNIVAASGAPSERSTAPASTENLGLNYQANTGGIVTSETAAFDGDRYFFFTLTLTDPVDFTTLMFKFGAGGGTLERSTFVRTSLDNFANNLGSSMSTEAVYSDVTYDMAAVYGALAEGVTGEVEFRFYHYNNSTTNNRTIVFDDITVSGAIIPEPSSPLIAVLGLGCLLVRRRR
ncbi:MAG: hypothetical protein ACNA8L_08855 [Luteolibacter sp.]